MVCLNLVNCSVLYLFLYSIIPFSTNFYTKRMTFKAVFFDFKNPRLFLNRCVQQTEKKIARIRAVLLLLHADVASTVPDTQLRLFSKCPLSVT